MKASDLRVGDVFTDGPWKGWRIHFVTARDLEGATLLEIQGSTPTRAGTYRFETRRIWLAADEEVEVQR